MDLVSGNIMDMTKATKPSPIQTGLNQIHEGLTFIHNEIDRMEGKLQPVLRESFPTAVPAEPTQDSLGNSAFAQQNATMHALIRNAVNRLGEITDRLEL